MTREDRDEHGKSLSSLDRETVAGESNHGVGEVLELTAWREGTTMSQPSVLRVEHC